MFNFPLRLDIQTETLEGKPVLVVSVPEIEASSKAVFFKAQGLPGGAFRRTGSTDQHCTEDALIALYAGAPAGELRCRLCAGHESG